MIIKKSMKEQIIFNVSQSSFKKYSLTFDFHFKIKSNYDVLEHEKVLKFNDFRLSIKTVKFDRDFFQYFIENMWKNILRKQFKLNIFDVNFLIITVTIIFISVCEMLIYDVYYMKSAVFWTDIVHFLSTNNSNEFDFIYTLQILNGNLKFDFEYIDFFLSI